MFSKQLQIMCSTVYLRSFCLALFLSLYPSSGQDFTNEEFTEELIIKRLQTGAVHSLFQFRTVLQSLNEYSFVHYNLFPKSLGQIIKKYDIQELHLSLTHGYWMAEKWGYPIQVAPPGAELWVWFSPDVPESSISSKWTGLVNALSGQFCASLNFMSISASINPYLSFKPLGLWPEGNENSTKYLRYATLPRENVCTENLTPWKKLLPCAGKAGLSSLLNALHLYNTAYQSLGVHLRSICKDAACLEASLELKQTLTTVHDPVTADVRKGWLLSRLYGRSLQSHCQVAKASKLLVDVTSLGMEYSLEPESKTMESKTLHDKTFYYAVYDLSEIDFTFPLNIALRFGNEVFGGKSVKPSLYSERQLTGYGGEYGGILCRITNSEPKQDLKIIYMDVLPWFVRVYLHTLKVTVNGKPLDQEYFRYVPSKDRTRPTLIELTITIPASSTVLIAVDFEKAFLKWTEHPPDSHHGFYIGSSVISTVLPTAANLSGSTERCGLLSSPTACQDPDELFVRLYTRPLLVILPTPDFSMPYNVICLTCTVLAVAFGGIFNAATKRLEVVQKDRPSWRDKVRRLISIILFPLKKVKKD